MVMSPRCSIFKIPTLLSRHNKKAYLPNAFSIGPFHHNNKKLKPTEKIKSKYFLDLISRVSNPNFPINPDSNPNPDCPINPNPNPNCSINPNSDHLSPDTISEFIRKFTKSIHKVHKDAREYYAGDIGMKTEKLVEILILDGCFIIELFC